MDFGWLLVRFLVDLGAKLESKLEQVGTKMDPKVRLKRCQTNQKNHRKKVMRPMQETRVMNGVGAPYKSTSRPSRGTPVDPLSLHSGTEGPVADKYVYLHPYL